MIDWVIDRVQQAGVFEILVLAPESIAKPISHHLRARRLAASQAAATATTHAPLQQPNARVELEEVPEEVASKNVVRVLMWAVEQNLITTDFILLPCDLVLSPTNNPPSSISLAALLDRHRSDDNLLTTLFSERAAGNVVQARKDGPPEILTIYDRKSSTLLDVREMDDYDDDEISLRTSLLARYPSPTLTTSLLPTQLYIYSSHVLSILTSPLHARRLRHIEDLQTLAGWLSRQSWRHQSSPAAAETAVGGPVVAKEEPPLAMGRSTTQRPSVSSRTRYLDARRRMATATAAGGVGVETPGLLGGGVGGGVTSEPASGFATGANTPALVSRNNSYGATMTTSPTTLSATTTTTITTAGGGVAGVTTAAAGGPAGVEAVGSRTTTRRAITTTRGAGTGGGCKIVVWRQEDGFAARGNSVAGFVEINRAALKLLPPSPPPTNTPPGVFISPDSHLHSSVYPHLGEKVGLKRCIVGKNTRVGKGSKLTSCVVMENVVIGENVKLDNCVVSNGVQIRDRASLKDCEIGCDVIVDFDSQVKGEQLVVEED